MRQTCKSRHNRSFSRATAKAERKITAVNPPAFTGYKQFDTLGQTCKRIACDINL